MAATAITVQTLSPNSKINNLTMTDADNTNTMVFANDGLTMLVWRNTNVATRTITVTSVAEGKFGRTGDITISVSATSGLGIAGPFQVEGFNNSSAQVAITPSANASSSDFVVAAVKFSVPR